MNARPATPVAANLPALPRRARRVSRRARAAFAWGAALFLFVQLTAGVALDRFGLPLRFAEASAVVARFSAEAIPR